MPEHQEVADQQAPCSQQDYTTDAQRDNFENACQGNDLGLDCDGYLEIRGRMSPGERHGLPNSERFADGRQEGADCS